MKAPHVKLYTPYVGVLGSELIAKVLCYVGDSERDACGWSTAISLGTHYSNSARCDLALGSCCDKAWLKYEEPSDYNISDSKMEVSSIGLSF